MFLCYCSLGTGKEIKALNGSKGVLIKHQERFFLGEEQEERSGTLLGVVRNCRWPQCLQPGLLHQAITTSPFCPHLPHRERKIWKWQPVGGISHKIALKTHMCYYPKGTIIFILQKLRKIEGKIWTGCILFWDVGVVEVACK